MAIATAGRFYARHVGFKEVRDYLKGELASESEQPSLILLSTNRSATQFVESVLAKIYEHQSGLYLPLNRYLFFADAEAEAHVLDGSHMRNLLKDRGFFFGQQGPFDDLSLFDGFQKVNVVRDPRDLVVSNYHSIASAHAPRDRAFIEKIKRVQELGLQKFARSEEFLEPIQRAFLQALALKDRDDVLAWRYEDLMEDFEGFESSCQRFILGEIDEDLSQEIRGMHLGSVQGEGEEKSRHRRSGRWGQFKTSLEPEVVAHLNEVFAPFLEAFGYEREFKDE